MLSMTVADLEQGYQQPGLGSTVVKERLGHDIRTTITVCGHLLPSVDDALTEGLDALHAVAAQNVATRPGQAWLGDRANY